MNERRRIGPVSVLVAALACSAPIAGCHPAAESAPAAGQRPAVFRFVERIEGSGIDFLDTHGPIGLAKTDLVDTLGGGVALIDYDADGDLDLFLANGDPGGGQPAGASRLYRNDGGFRFSDVTERSGIAQIGAAAGVAVGDIDRDGLDDLFVSGFGRNTLWHNLGGGRFVEIAREVGVDRGGIGASAAFADLDGDGDLDLYVCSYIVWDGPARELARKGGMFRGQHVLFGPRGFEKPRNTLFANRLVETGRLHFDDQTAQAGLAGLRSYSLGVVAVDIDDDGDVDLYVANDSEANWLLINDGSMHFVDHAAESGTAYDTQGRPQASMGVDCRDVDGDGSSDLFFTNFSHDYDTLYRNLGNGFFADVSLRYGLVEPSYLPLGWGCALADLDLDGDLDLAVANGHVFPNVDGTPLNTTYAQVNLIYENVGGTTLRQDVDPWRPEAQPAVSRGLAKGDLDGDGREDLVFTTINGRPSLMRNETESGSAVVLRLVGMESNPNAIGARVTATVDGIRPQVLRILGGGSYQSASALDVVIGLGQAAGCTGIEIRWPSGRIQSIGPVERNTLLVVREGAQQRPSPLPSGPRRG